LEMCEGSEHSAMRLLGLWKEAYGSGSGDSGDKQRPRFDMQETKRKVDALRNVQPLDEGYVQRMWVWIHANVR
jgi:hypothetical protein